MSSLFPYQIDCTSHISHSYSSLNQLYGVLGFWGFGEGGRGLYESCTLLKNEDFFHCIIYKFSDFTVKILLVRLESSILK